MAFKNVRTLIRVDCSPISETLALSKKIREIEGFHTAFSDYNYFKIGETSNFRNGTLKDMDPNEFVYRYSKEEDGTSYVFDLTSRFYYIRILGKGLPSDLNVYFRIIDDVTRIVLDHDKFVKIKEYGIGKEYEEKKDTPDETDKIERDAYMSQAHKARVVYQKREQSNAVRYTILLKVEEVDKNPDYTKGDKLFGTSFQLALKEAEEKYG